MARTINVEINGQFVRKDNKNAGVMGEGNVTTMSITFDETWRGFGKRIVWRDANGENPVSVILFDGNAEEAEATEEPTPMVYTTTIPREPMEIPGWCSFSIEGFKEENGVHKVSLSVSDTLMVAQSDSYHKPAEPTPSQTQQILEELGKTEDAVKASATEAKSWAIGGTGTRTGEDTDNAKYYAQQAGASKTASGVSAAAAAASAQNAAASEAEAKNHSNTAATWAIAAQTARNEANEARDQANLSAAAAAASASAAEDSAEKSELKCADSAYFSKVSRIWAEGEGDAGINCTFRDIQTGTTIVFIEPESLTPNTEYTVSWKIGTGEASTQGSEVVEASSPMGIWSISVLNGAITISPYDLHRLEITNSSGSVLTELSIYGDTAEFGTSAKEWAEKAKAESDSATTSASNASTSARDASSSASNAAAAASSAYQKADEAANSASSASASAGKAKTSETNAKASETASKNSETAAAQSASSAASSAAAVEKIKDDSAVSAAAALASEKAAKTSESNAKTSETNAASSKTAAAASASAAKTSETNAKSSETNAKASETNAKSSETAARGHAEDAEAAQSAIENMTVSVKTLAPGSNATATKTTVGNVVNIEYGIPRGEQGQGFKILGYYDNLSALQSGVPSPNIGDAYGIGTASPYDIYIWDGKAWKNNGPIQGPAGQKGEDGTDGRAATVRVGTVTTGAPGSNATVNNSGTQSDAVLDFTIPRGTNGQNGADGADGENGGYYSPAVDASGNLTWTASKSGMPSVSGANIRGPQGNDGAPGQKGDPGSAGVDGKSAYQSAKENGYTGTEAEFYAALVSMKDAPFLPTSGGVMKQGAKIAFESDSGPSVYVNRQNGDLTITKNTYVNVKLGSSGVELLAAKGLSSTKLIASTDGSIQLLPAGKTVNCGSSKLSAVENPTEDTDAATKGYVDSLVGQIGTTLDSINGEVV